VKPGGGITEEMKKGKGGMARITRLIQQNLEKWVGKKTSRVPYAVRGGSKRCPDPSGLRGKNMRDS